jgi:tetratricopeptide (TPR) repeat protein
MKKWIMYGILAILVGIIASSYAKTGKEMDKVKQQISQLQEVNDPDEQVGKLESKLHGMESERTFSGILMTFLGAGLVGIFFVVTALPFITEKLTQSVFDSGEVMEKSPMDAARSQIAQGNYAEAIESYKEAAALDPLNRLPWVEISKIYKDYLHDSPAAVQTIRHALESQEWEINDAAYFLFRLAELYDEVDGNRPAAVQIMNQVIEQFPNTRHSANASHKLHEWANAGEIDTQAAEEAAFMAKQRASKQS